MSSISASKNTGFKPNPERTEGTYSKYASIDDKFDGDKINKEFTSRERKKYPGLTKYVQGLQIAGSKVFEFKWVIIEIK